jgi:hypothetical protein
MLLFYESACNEMLRRASKLKGKASDTLRS